jgi:branched-chain amino acid transport system permease protein
MPLRRYLPLAVLVALVVVVQLAVTLAGARFYLTQLTMAAYYCLVVTGLCLLMGFAGQISLGQAGFFAIGGYTSAVLSTLDLSSAGASPALSLLRRLGVVYERQDLYGHTLLNLSPWLGLVVAMVVTILVALLIGLPVMRLKGHYLAMATLGFGLIIYRVILGTHALGEADGISSVPPFPLFGLSVGGSMAGRIQNYYVAWGLVALGVLLALNLVHSRVGRALRSIHGSEEAAGAMGVDTARYKLATFVLSAVYAAVAGVFLTHYNGGIGPSEAGGMKSVRYVAIVAAGGMGNLWGTLLMGASLSFLSLRGYFGSYDDAVFALILLLIMLFAPRGLLRLSLFRAWLPRRRRAGSGQPSG